MPLFRWIALFGPVFDIKSLTMLLGEYALLPAAFVLSIFPVAVSSALLESLTRNDTVRLRFFAPAAAASVPS